MSAHGWYIYGSCHEAGAPDTVLLAHDGPTRPEHHDQLHALLAGDLPAETSTDPTQGVYRERAHLVALLAALYPSHIGYTDPAEPDWAVVIIESPAGQLSWHIAPGDMDLFGRVQVTSRICRGWDGHSTEEKYRRIRELTASTELFPLPPLPAPVWPRPAEVPATRTCTGCDGTGERRDFNADGEFESVERCGGCDGTGRVAVEDESCDEDAPSCRDCGTWPCARHATDEDRAEYQQATGSDAGVPEPGPRDFWAGDIVEIHDRDETYNGKTGIVVQIDEGDGEFPIGLDVEGFLGLVWCHPSEIRHVEPAPAESGAAS